MTLGRQLAGVISLIFFVALAAIEAVHLHNAQKHLQQQLESVAQDAATSIGLSLGSLMRGADPALIDTVFNPVFERGHYAGIEFVTPGGERLIGKRLAIEAGEYPAWFARLFPLDAPTAESLVTSRWEQLGKVRVTAHPRFAYEQLWDTARDTILVMLLVYVAGLAALQLLLRGILRPLTAVERAAEQISARNFVTLALKPATRELARVVKAMNTLSRKVNEAIESESRRAERLQIAVFTDDVTGLLNARGFSARFESIYEGERETFSGVLALVELGQLGAINQQLGQERCDELLRNLNRRAAELSGVPGGFAGRWSGPQAILAMPRIDAAAARARLAAIRTELLLLLREYGLERFDRICCGGVEAAGGLSLRDLARRAGEALLQSRESADGVVVLESSRGERAHAHAEDPAQVVRQALAERRLQLVGQKAYRMSDHRILHTEIMSRLRDAEGMEMAAARFMPIVAAHGLVEELDRRVIERVVQAVRGMDEAISINVSIHSAERPEFGAWLAELLARERAASRLVFEIAEHGVLQNEPAATAFAALLAKSGVGFAIDNFGVHRDSLALARRLQPAYVKLAGAHTPGMVSEVGARFFAESLVRACRQLEIPVIAQMVEDDPTFRSLGALGFTGYQGNLADRPTPWPAAS